MRISDWSSTCALPISGLEGEADVRRGRVDLRRADDGNQQQGDDKAGGDRREGIAWRHGHQNADRVAAPGSMPPPDGSASPAVDPGGLPRSSPDWPPCTRADRKSVGKGKRVAGRVQLG